MSSPSYNYTSWFSNERTMVPGLFVYTIYTIEAATGKAHEELFNRVAYIYISGHDLGFPEILSATARMRICVCVCVCVCACRLCRSANQTTLLYIQHYLLRPAFSTSVFCVRTGNRAKDSRTADHTRNHRARPRRRRRRLWTSRLCQTPSALL